MASHGSQESPINFQINITVLENTSVSKVMTKVFIILFGIILIRRIFYDKSQNGKSTVEQNVLKSTLLDFQM